MQDKKRFCRARLHSMNLNRAAVAVGEVLGVVAFLPNRAVEHTLERLRKAVSEG